MEYNKKHNITPKSTSRTLKEKETVIISNRDDFKSIPKDELRLLIKDLEDEMADAASKLDFERAADLRDQIANLKGLKK